ncbi:Glucan endo-1,3-beta-glucosidase, partial [Linum grandiflorum]
IGVNYGTQANNLPPPSQVATFLKSHTTIDRVKIFDANPDILRAFADTGISVTVTIANADAPSLSKLPAAQAWISTNILPFHRNTKIKYLLVGNEVLYWKDINFFEASLFVSAPSMLCLHSICRLFARRVGTPATAFLLKLSMLIPFICIWFSSTSKVAVFNQ